MTIMIGIDPHKASHTAVAVDTTEVVIDELRCELARPGRAAALVGGTVSRIECGRSSPPVGSATSLAQQLVAAGETVVRRAGGAVDTNPPVGVGPVAEERPERRPLGGDRGVAPNDSAASGR